MVCEVIVDISHSEVDKVFDYKTGDLRIEAGSRVCVPFANRKIEGFVIKLKDRSEFPENKLKNVK